MSGGFMQTDFLSYIDLKSKLLTDTSDYIWDNPELAFTEFRSAAKLQEVLKDEGFLVENGLAGIETAFSGTFGHGRPVIGILGEFDALSGLGQEPVQTEKKPNGQPCGHGCGHNLLGAASLGAAMALKHFLETTGKEGTVIFFGCPGEEGGSGKAFMARDGVFDSLDAALTWHPADKNYVRNVTSTANYQILYKFDGQAAHAAAHPHLGRSALDAVELMNIGVNFLREHVDTSIRMHYSITDAGGASPNVVQSHAEVLYLLRAPVNTMLPDLYDRVNDIARGAALMTGTKESHEFIKACSNTVLNDAIQQRLYECMKTVGVPEVTNEDLAYAKELTEKALCGLPDADPAHPIHYELEEYVPHSVVQKFGSTDVGDVSWVCPTGQIGTATEAFGTPGHSWQECTQGKAPLAHKMMIYAAKVLALCGSELFTDPKLLEDAKSEFRKAVGPEGYVCPIPKDVKPRSMSSFSK